LSLKNKICVVTGGNSGIGRATALKMAAEGATLVIVGRSQDTIDSAVTEIQAVGAEVDSYSLDVGDADAVTRMAEAVLSKHGRVDVLVNCAGGGVVHKRLLTTTPDDMRRAIDSNLLGTIYTVQAFLPAMLEAGEGTIINVSSGASRGPGLLGGMIYGAAKAGVNNVTEFINSEFRNSGVRACLVIPGEVDTPALPRNRPIPPSEEGRALMLKAEDMADAITLIARMPQRAHIQELVIRPTMYRDTSAETPPA